MRRIYYSILLIITAFTFFSSCTKSDLDSHNAIENDGVKPGPVSNVQVTNMPGAASLTYTLPKDLDLQYVLAEYSINSSTVRQAKTSRYNDTINVDGFDKAGEYTVTLYAVDKGENKSDPVTVKVNPTTPPFRIIAATLKLTDDFGGLNISFSNPGENKIALVVLTKDNNGEFSPIETFYTQIKDGSYAVRGFDTIARIFGAYIKDRWNNNSDTLFKTIHPIPEKKLDKTKFSQYKLPGDQSSAWGWEMPYLWDNKINGDGPGFHTLQGADPHPHKFTFDLGVIAKLSRFKMLQRWDGYLYSHGNPRYYTMWGTASTPDASGSWNGWTKLMDCESIKPSGLPVGQTTDEDLNYAKGTDGLGEEFTFPASTPAVRYIRLELQKNWSGTDFFHAIEITFWGNPQ
ncbi:MAG: DUF5000 domain-containing lipoprotein [Ferruginibacter sp.]